MSSAPSEKPFASYAAETHAAKSRLRRFSHGARFGLATSLAIPPGGGTLLDYGVGDGAYLANLAGERPDLALLAWHPFPDEHEKLITHLAPIPGITVERDIDAVEAGSVDVITVLEVFEHLPPHVFAREMDRIERILGEEGRLVVTVPIEVGPGSVGKNLARIATKTTHARTSLGSIARAGVGRPIGRPGEDYILSHMGFDHRALLRGLQARGWVIEERATSPLPLVGSVLNSQIGWRLKRA